MGRRSVSHGLRTHICPGYLVSLAVLFSVILVSGCSSGTLAAKIREPSSVHYVQTVSMTFGTDTTTEQTEGYYEAPDSARIVLDPASTFIEGIVIGNEGWVRGDSGWTTSDAGSIRSMVLTPIQLILDLPDQADFSSVDVGPTVNGEETRRYSGAVENVREAIASTIEGIVASSPECGQLLSPIPDVFSNTESSVEMVVGLQTHWPYHMVQTFDGPGFTASVVVTLDQHDEAFHIQAPAGARIAMNSTEAPTAC